MPLKPYLLLSLILIATTLNAQDEPQPFDTLNIGDAAPPLRLRAWLKGQPVKQFEKDKLYVVEFWATWCKPCVAAMPHLSALAREYKDKVTFIGISVYENKKTTLKRIKSFVDSLGSQIDYTVAAEDSNYMAVDWVDALAEPGIPRSFIINKEGKIAWTGHPEKLDEVLPSIVNNTWSVSDAFVKRKENLRLAAMDGEVQYLVLPYMNNPAYNNHPYKPDTLLIKLEELVANEPGLKYAPLVSFYTFGALLHTDLKEAYEYAKAVMVTETYEEPQWYSIIWNLELYADSLNLPVEFYRLGIEAWQARINWIPYPELVNLPRMYKNMAAFYWKANDNAKAIESVQKAIEILKTRKDATEKDMKELDSRLDEYNKASKAF